MSSTLSQGLEAHPVLLPQSKKPLILSLLPWQQRVFDQAKHLNEVALYLEQGVGKTHIALALADTWRSSISPTKPLLVIAPLTSIGLVWKPFLEQLGVPYVITHPEALCKHKKRFWKRQWAVCIVDEAHQYKNHNSKRSKALAGLAKTERKIILTGTPLEKDPLDLWAQFRFLNPELLGDKWTTFKENFLMPTGYMGHDLKIRPGKLGIYLKRLKPYIFDVRRKEVLDIKSKRVIARPFMTQRQRQIYNDLEEHMIAEFEDGIITAQQAAVKLGKLHQVAGGFAYNDDGEAVMLSDAKIQAMMRYMDRKVVIFCRYSHEIEGLRRYLSFKGYPVQVLDGSIPAEDRPRVVNRFNRQKEGVLIAQIRVGGISINLQSAARAIFYSLPMSRTDFEQARARLLRYGQESFVDFIILLSKDSVDEYIYDLLKSKGRTIDMVLKYLKRRKK